MKKKKDLFLMKKEGFISHEKKERLFLMKYK
jgi:hypothetical protein